MISPRVNYQLCGLNSFYWRNVISTLLHGTRGTAYGSSRYFFSSSLFFFLPSPFFARRPNGRTFEATRPLASGLAWPPTEYRSSGNRPKLMPGFNIPANMDIFGFAAKRQAQPSLSSLLSDLVATRNTILRISSSILIPDRSPSLPRPWRFSFGLVYVPLLPFYRSEPWSVLEQGPSRSVYGCATFFSHVIGLELGWTFLKSDYACAL